MTHIAYIKVNGETVKFIFTYQVINFDIFIVCLVVLKLLQKYEIDAV